MSNCVCGHPESMHGGHGTYTFPGCWHPDCRAFEGKGGCRSYRPVSGMGVFRATLFVLRHPIRALDALAGGQ